MNPVPSDQADRLKGRSRSPQNGYLMYVPGELIAEGSSTLPTPAETENFKPERTVEVHVPNLGGKVRITYALRKHRHHKTTRWSWVALWAEPINADGQPLSAP